MNERVSVLQKVEPSAREAVRANAELRYLFGDIEFDELHRARTHEAYKKRLAEKNLPDWEKIAKATYNTRHRVAIQIQAIRHAMETQLHTFTTHKESRSCWEMHNKQAQLMAEEMDTDEDLYYVTVARQIAVMSTTLRRLTEVYRQIYHIGLKATDINDYHRQIGSCGILILFKHVESLLPNPAST